MSFDERLPICPVPRPERANDGRAIFGARAMIDAWKNRSAVADNAAAAFCLKAQIAEWRQALIAMRLLRRIAAAGASNVRQLEEERS